MINLVKFLDMWRYSWNNYAYARAFDKVPVGTE